MTPSLPPPPEARYTELLRREPFDAFRVLLMLGAGFFGYVLVSVINQLLIAAAWQVRGAPGEFATFLTRATRFEVPDGMVAAHLAIGTMIVTSLLALRFIGGLSPRWVMSVKPGMRWGFLGLCVVAAVVVINAGVWLTQGSTLTNPNPQSDFVAFMIVIVLTSPIQAAAEEFFFRGLLLTGLGSFVRNEWFGIVVSALVFAAFHGVQNPPLFLDRFVFGVLAGALVVRTGGLEAPIAAHVVNNLSAFTYAAVFTSVSAARTTTTITWAGMVADVTTFAVFAVAAWGIGRWRQVATRTPAPPRPGLARKRRMR